MPTRNPVVKRWLFSSWFAFCAGVGLVAVVLNAYDHERYLSLMWGSLLLVGDGLGCWRCWHLRTSNEIRVLSAALAFVFGLLFVRSFLFFTDLLFFYAPIPNTVGVQIDLFLTSMVIAGFAALGVLIFFALDPDKNRTWLAQRIGINPLIRPSTRQEQDLQDTANEARDLAKDTNKRVRNVEGIVKEETGRDEETGE